MKILLTASAGHQGKRLLPKLAAAGHHVRAARATPGRNAELEALGAAEVFTGDLRDVETYTKALDGCDSLYHVGPMGIVGEKDSGLAMIEAARRCGTRHVVMSSVSYSIIDIVQHRFKRDIEEELYKAGLPFTILKPCDFMTPFPYFWPLVQEGKLPIFWPIKPGRRGSLIDVEDLAQAAANVLNEGARHHYATYDLAGPDRLTPPQIAAIASRVLNRSVEVVQVSPEEMTALGLPNQEVNPDAEHLTEICRSIARWYAQHDFVGNPNILEWLLGRPANSFEQFLRRSILENAVD